MFRFILLLLILIRCVDTLICATNCDFETQIDNVTLPFCTVVNKSSTAHSCEVTLTIDYHSGSVIGRLDATTSLWRYDYYTQTYFSLYDATSNVTIGLGCSTTNNCDQEFVKETLSGDWRRVQSVVMDLRKNLEDLLFNSSDLRPHDTCIGRKNCSGDGFCAASYNNNCDGTGPELGSRCEYSTNQPLLEWVDQINENSRSKQTLYTCNKPSCATSTTVQRIVEMIQSNYVLPLNVTVPSTTTTTRSSTMSKTTSTASTPTTSTPTASTSIPTASTSTPTASASTTPIQTTPTTSTPISTSPISTSTKNVARVIHSEKTKKILFAFFFVVFVCLFGI